jgi:hypothetical protein
MQFFKLKTLPAREGYNDLSKIHVLHLFRAAATTIFNYRKHVLNLTTNLIDYFNYKNIYFEITFL